MDEAVDIKVNSDPGEAQTMLNRIAEAFERIADKGQKAGEHGGGFLARSVKDAKDLAIGILGAESAIGMLEKAWDVFAEEVDRWLERMQKKAETFTELGQAQEKFALTSSPSTIKILEELEAKVG